MKDWTKDIQKMMQGFEMEAPEGLWEELSALGAGKRAASRRNAVIWLSYAGLAAACLAITLIFSHSNHGVTIDTTPSPQVIAETTPGQIDSDIISTQPDNGVSASQSGNGATASQIAANGAPSKNQDATKQAITDGKTLIAENADNKKDSNADGKKLVDEASRQAVKTAGDDAYDIGDEVATNRGRNRITVTVVSGTNANSRTAMAYRGAGPAAIGPQGAEWGDSPMLGMLTYNGGLESMKLSHHMPIKAGIVVGYQFANRWSVETGITYTHLLSDIWQQGSVSSLNGEQRLDYIGVPVSFRYSAFKNSYIDLYASAGAGMDMCLLGKSSMTYNINGRNIYETRKIAEHPLQLSLSLNAGVAYKITPMIHIFAEPGLSYYFSNKSGIETIFSSRPLNFCINTGLRFALGNN